MARLRPCPGSGGTIGMASSLSSRTRTPKSCASRLPMSEAPSRQRRRKANPPESLGARGDTRLVGRGSDRRGEGAGYRSRSARGCWFSRGRLFRRGCAGLFAAGQAVIHAFHGEEGGDDGDEDGCELEGPYGVKNAAIKTIANGAAASAPSAFSGPRLAPPISDTSETAAIPGTSLGSTCSVFRSSNRQGVFQGRRVSRRTRPTATPDAAATAAHHQCPPNQPGCESLHHLPPNVITPTKISAANAPNTPSTTA